MLDEGTERLDAVAFSRALEDIGAQLDSGADREKSSVSLQVLSAKLPEALALMGAAVTRPRHAEADWKRVSSLWKNALKARGDDPHRGRSPGHLVGALG
jgi:predicted Zn-dependent peptidase